MDNFLELLKNRRSCRRFTEQPVDENKVCDLMKAALMSPSGHRINPWEFIMVDDKEMLRQLSMCKAAGAALLEGAALAVVVIGDTNKTDVWVEDCSIATILIQLAAEELGLGSCWVQVRKRFDADGVSADENVKRLLAIPENYAVLSIVAVGYKERESKPFDEDKMQWEKIHIGTFGGNSRIVIVGAGNLATCLGLALKRVGVVPRAVWSRSEASASSLADKLGCPYTTDIDSLPVADVVITAVSDDALPAVAARLVAKYSDALLVHTAGSVPMDIWADAGAQRYGVFYPMQTFSKAKEVDFSRLGIFVESAAEDDCSMLEALARRLTTMVYRATSQQRAYLHIAAVYACNFANAMYAMAAEVLGKQGLPFEVMLPLIDETAEKLHHLSPQEAQTGPARRGDTRVMARQRAMLDGDIAAAYDIISRYICDKATR